MTAPNPIRLSIPIDKSSSRLGERVRLLVGHSAEGALSVQSLAEFFAKNGVQASSHVGIDDLCIGTFVPRSRAAWTLRNGNQESMNAEMCAFAAWTRAEWFQHVAMLDNFALWLAEESAHFDIPLVHLSVPETLNAMVDDSHPGGVIIHRDYTLATRDGTHIDTGRNMPLDDYVLPLARRLRWPSIPKLGPIPGDHMETIPAGTKGATFQYPLFPGRANTVVINTGGRDSKIKSAAWVKDDHKNYPVGWGDVLGADGKPVGTFTLRANQSHTWRSSGAETSIVIEVEEAVNDIKVRIDPAI